MRYLIGIIGTIGLVILILVLLLRGGGSTPAQTKSFRLSDYAKTNSTAEYVVDGPVVADQNHEELKIDVTADTITASVYDGYEGNLVKQQTYANNQSAYTVFLLSLQTEGFTRGDKDSAKKDERGVCPLGQRRIYDFNDGSKQTMRFWSTSCGSKTFAGSIGGVAALFQRQVPDYGTFVRGSDFNSTF